jgi:PAS domain S-box-containing protein
MDNHSSGVNLTHAEQALYESESMYREMFENAPILLFTADLEGRFTSLNQYGLLHLGYRLEEIIGKSVLDVVLPEYRDLVKSKIIEKLMGVDITTYTVEALNCQGEKLFLELDTRLIFAGEQPIAIYGAGRDVTELKHGQEALQESKILLNNIIDFLPDATMVIDSKGQVLAWNRAMVKMTGFSATEMLGKNNYEYALPIYKKRQPILIDLALKIDELPQHHYPFINREGNQLTSELFVPNFGNEGAYLWVIATPLYNSNGEIIGAIESIRDITNRRQMEDELINQTESLSTVLEHSPTGIAIVDYNDHLVFINTRFTEITSYTLADIPTLEVWYEKAYPNEKSRNALINDWCQQLTLKQKAIGYARVHCKNGQVKNVEFHGIKLPDQRTIISIWDMTWQKQVEEALRVEEARFKALSDASFEGIILTENEICIEVNQKAAQMYGYEYQEMLGRNSLDFIAPELRSTVKDHLHNNYELPYESIAMRKDGSRLPVEIQGRMFEYQGRKMRAAAIRDLSDRQQVEAEISKQRLYFQALFFNSPDALAFCNLKHEILDINHHFYNLFGYTLEECRYKQIHELIVPPEQLEEYWENRRLASKDAPLPYKEIVRQHQNGSLIDVMLKVVNIPDHGFYLIYSDISVRKQTEHIIGEQLRELEAKNAEMERFTYTVSHDLRSPLITIKGFAGLLMDDLKHGNHSRLENDLQRIINAAGKMDDLLHDLLELSRIGRVLTTFTRFSMSSLAMEVAELLTGRLQEKGVKLIIESDMPKILADHSRIREVLQNLVENAIKFMGNQDHPQIEIGSLKNPGEWTFFVRDNGIGIEERYHYSIFGLFNQLDPNCEGTGIGLSLVKRIIEYHKGRLRLESAGLGTGSTFYFSLPHTTESIDRRVY